MSRLRARCPACHTFTAVALGEAYECHACGRGYLAGLVRVPRAWGHGGEDMAAAAWLELPYPEAAVVEGDTLPAQTLQLARVLPARPIVLGGCCCAHVGAVQGLASRFRELAVLWLDAHGDLNTPESSPSGNSWGMALRMLIDFETVRLADVVLVGARQLDDPEAEFVRERSLAVGVQEVEETLARADAVYVAVDLDVLDPASGVAVHFAEPGGLSLPQLEAILGDAVARCPLAGVGLTGLVPAPENVDALGRVCRALGL